MFPYTILRKRSQFSYMTDKDIKNQIQKAMGTKAALKAVFSL